MTTGRVYPIAVLAALMLIVMCGQGYAASLKAIDDRNREIELGAKPQRIISLAPTHTELLYALGLEKELVGVTKYCDYPEAAKQKETIGGFIDFDLEKIRSLKPDLVLAFGTIQLQDVEALEKSGLTVFWIYPHGVKDILDSFERIGRITGAEQAAHRLRAAVEKDLAELRSGSGDLADDKRPSVLRIMGFNRPSTIGALNFQTDLFRVAGGRNAFPAPGRDYTEVDGQELIKSDPAVVLVCGDDEKGLKRKLKDHPVYSRLPAVQKDSVLVMPCELTCRPGPRIAEAAKRLAEFLKTTKE